MAYETFIACATNFGLFSLQAFALSSSHAFKKDVQNWSLVRLYRDLEPRDGGHVTGGYPPPPQVVTSRSRVQEMTCINMSSSKRVFRVMMEAIKEEEEEKRCTICLNPSDFQDEYTYCCREPIHYNCMETLMYDDHLERQWNEIKCPFCKILLNSKECDAKVKAEEKRLSTLPYFEDEVYADDEGCLGRTIVLEKW